MRRDLEEWLKGKSKLLRGLEASGKDSGLPVVPLLKTSDKKAPFNPTPEGSMALLARDAPEERREESVTEPEPPSLGQFHGKEDCERTVRNDEPAPSSGFSSDAAEAREEARLLDPGVGPAPQAIREPPGISAIQDSAEAVLFPEEAQPRLPEEGDDPASSQDSDGTSRFNSAPLEDSEEIKASPDPSLSEAEEAGEGITPQSHGSETGPDTRLTERLRRVSQMRRTAMEAVRRAEAPQRRLRLAILGAVAILVFGTIFALYRHIRNNSQSAISQEAQSLFEEAKYDEAVASYQRGVDRYPEVPAFLLGLARSSARAGNSEQALAAWRLYLNQLPDEEASNRAQTLYEIGRLYALRKNPDKAIEHLVQSSSLDSAHYDTHFALGRLFEERDRPAEALNAYRLALELRPSSREALDAVKRVAGLISPLPSPETRDPDQEYKKHLEVGTVALNLQRYDDALTHFSQALSIRSDDERPWLGLSGAYQGQGRDAEALKLLQDTQCHIPDSVTIRAKIEELEQSQKKAIPPSPAKRRKKAPARR